VIAASEDGARALAGAALAVAKGPVVMDVFDEQRGFAAWLQACGFRAQRPLFRMHRPPRRASAEGRVDRLRPGPPDVGLRGYGEAAEAFANAEALPHDSTPGRNLVQFAIFGPDFA
jgi:hypothetical protein